MEHIFLKKKLPPPYLLGYGVHWRLSLNGCLLDTANELDDGVRQTHVMGANRGDACFFFFLQLFFASKRPVCMQAMIEARGCKQRFQSDLSGIPGTHYFAILLYSIYSSMARPTAAVLMT